MKEIIPLLLATATLSNTLVQNQTRASADIRNNINLVQEVIYEPNNITIEYATYYQVKEFTNHFNLEYAQVDAKGYTYQYINYAIDSFTLITDYYFYITYQDGTQYNFSFDDIAINLRGYLNPTSTADLYYEDYYLYGSNTSMQGVQSFILGNNYTYNQLNNLYTLNGWTTLSNINYVETVEENTTLTLDTKYTYLKWQIIWESDSAWDENGKLLPTTSQNTLNALSTVYTSSTIVYSWNIDINYNYEVIDIPGLLLEIIGMPFAWIGTAFNVTLFSGTPYAINVSRLFFEIICTLIIIVVLRKVIK